MSKRYKPRHPAPRAPRPYQPVTPAAPPEAPELIGDPEDLEQAAGEPLPPADPAALGEAIETREAQPPHPAGPRRFTVSGLGDFPLRMLHIDSCWPATLNDVRAIDPTRPREDHNRNRRTVVLETARATIISTQVWADLHWPAIEGEHR